MSESFPFELAIYVSDKYLCAFVEVDLSTVVDHVVLEVGEVLCEEAEEGDG
jgi:hypothetical protein